MTGRFFSVRSGASAPRLVAVTGAIATAFLLGLALRAPSARAGDDLGPSPATPAQALPVSTQVSYADLASRVAPSVVTVRSERLVTPTSGEFPSLDDPLLRRFFGDGERGSRDRRRLPPATERESGLGSGVVVSADGYILTNDHVVSGAQRVQVDLADRRTFSAKLVGSDKASDLAVLKIDASKLTPLPLGDSNAVRVGDVVLAFGNPLGVGQTVTMGIISAKGRATGLADGGFEDFLQTDAPINQGNSGGALVNLKGELVGINSQIVSPSGGNIGIGFAIPASMAENVMTQLIQGGKVRRGQLGVTVQAVTSDVAKSLGLERVVGSLVDDVVPRSPADQAGIRRGDVILRLNGAEISSSNSLRNQVSSLAPGSKVDVTVLRKGREQTLSAKLAELKDVKSAEDSEPAQPEGGKLGLSLRPLSPREARDQGLKSSQGLLVAGVDPTGPASDAGFRPGDVIEEVNGQPVADVPSLRAAVKSAGARPSLVLVGRDGAALFLTLTTEG